MADGEAEIPIEAADEAYPVQQHQFYEELARAGCMLLDSGATTQVCGLAAADEIQLAAVDSGLGDVQFDQGDTRTFTFGNGEQDTSLGTAVVPAVLGTAQVGLPISILDRPAPPLLGVGILNQSKAVVDFGDHPGVWFEGLGGPKTSCLRLSSGHLALKVVPGAPDPSE